MLASDNIPDLEDSNHHPRPEEIEMSQDARNRYVTALTKGEGLHDGFIYSMTFDDYKAFPDPFPRTTFAVREVEARVSRYPNPQRRENYLNGTFMADCSPRRERRFPALPSL